MSEFDSYACSVCGVQVPKMKLCTRCRVVYYCSRECQVTNWPSHKSSCGKAISPEVNAGPYRVGVDDSNVVHSDQRINYGNGTVGPSEEMKKKDGQKNGDNEKDFTQKSYLHNNSYCHDVPVIDSSEAISTVTLKFNKKKEKMNVQNSWTGIEIWKTIAHVTKIPLEMITVIFKGKKLTPEFISGVIKDKAVLLVLGEIAEDEEGVDNRDVQVLMQQMSVGRNDAVKTIKKCGNLVDAMLLLGSK